jgi:hypothetical protein
MADVFNVSFHRVGRLNGSFNQGALAAGERHRVRIIFMDVIPDVCKPRAGFMATWYSRCLQHGGSKNLFPLAEDSC